MQDTLYWVWLSLLFPQGSAKFGQVLSVYDSPEEFYRAPAKERAALPFLTERDRLSVSGTGLARAEKILRDCEKHEITILPYAHPDYPKRLKLIYAPPPVLYVKGDLSGLDEEVAITVVGTRKSTDYSSYLTEYLSYQLASAGAIIVSGCAVGIDAAAHSGAIRAKGRTIAVLGCGLDVDYPKENAGLKEAILKRGALLSELPPGSEPNGKLFPVRNRLLAGLSLGVLVTHAPERSGSLITVEHALEQGRDVFCVPPYSLFDGNFTGVVKYLRDGAIPVFSAEDVLGQYTGAYAHKLDLTKLTGDYVGGRQSGSRAEPAASKPKAETQKKKSQPDKSALQKQYMDLIEKFDGHQLAVYNALDLAPKYVDELSRESGIGAGEILSILTEFEIMGLVTSLGAQRYALSQK